MTRKRIRELALMSIVLIGYTAAIYSAGASQRPETAPLTLEIAGCEVDPVIAPAAELQPL